MPQSQPDLFVASRIQLAEWRDALLELSESDCDSVDEIVAAIRSPHHVVQPANDAIQLGLDALCVQSFDIANNHGFWADPYPGNELAIPAKLALCIGELVEALECHHKADKITAAGEDWQAKFAEELGDAVIRIADLAGRMGINLGEVVVRKAEVNRKRAYKHGNGY